MTDTTDWQLIRKYVQKDAQAAFAALVRRHLGMVYCTCLRELGEPSLAEDATQAVFLILARKARTFRPGTTLSSWLFQTALLTSKNVSRRERRRLAREEKLVMKMEHAAPSPPFLWSDLEPLLNEALRALPDKPRGLVLERFLEDRPLAEIGAARGISEDAARMRLNRALDSLRRFFARRDVLLSAAALAALLPQAVHPAPAHCAEALLRPGLPPAAAPASGTPAHVIAQGAIHTMNLYRLRLQLGAAALVTAFVLGPAGAVRVSSERRAHAVRAEQQQTVAPAQSVSAAPQQGDPQALAVLNRMYAAYTAMQSFRCHEVIREDDSGANADTEYEIERPGKVRFDRVTLFDPGKVHQSGAVDMSGQALAVSDGRDLFVTFTPNHKPVKQYAEVPLSDPESNSYNFADWGGLPSSGGASRAGMPTVAVGLRLRPLVNEEEPVYLLGRPTQITFPGEQAPGRARRGHSRAAIRKAVRAAASQTLARQMTYYIGRQDHLLYQVVAVDALVPGKVYTTTTERIDHVEINPKIDPADFTFTPPPGSHQVGNTYELFSGGRG